jgi:hypothetical protein
MVKTNVSVKQPEPPIRKEILAEAIVSIGKGAAQLSASGLNKRAILVLLHDRTKLPMRDIETVLDALPRLASWYTR